MRALAGSVVFGTVVGLLIGGSYLEGASARQALAKPSAPTQIRLALLTTPAPTAHGLAPQALSAPLSESARITTAALTKVTLAPEAAKPASMTLRDRFRIALSVTSSVAEPFHFRGEPAREASGHGADANCLAQAVYYEARGESPSGQAAVAQVVLNRVRHPAFPKTICGVVFQKSGQGCQFSFACNGSMHAGLEPGAWRRAEQVAQHALGGAVMTDVGEATQFQAARAGGWANGLLKVAQIGEHVFYRFAGHRGSSGMFHDQAQPSSAQHAGAAADVRVATLSPTPAPKLNDAAVANAPVQPATAAVTSPPVKPAGEPAPAAKPSASVVTAVKAEDAPSKPVTLASSGA
ncbi:MAG: cell wall hydrolase [Caulobacteraceae bacterium]